MAGGKVEKVSVCGRRTTNGKVFCLEPSTTNEIFQSQRTFLVNEFGDSNDKKNDFVVSGNWMHDGDICVFFTSCGGI